ncbi:MAG: TonB-dependent receptor [Spirochaetia bacterium]|nr:TonB-dependent receptor [Spirochaetia bacterium]
MKNPNVIMVVWFCMALLPALYAQENVTAPAAKASVKGTITELGGSKPVADARIRFAGISGTVEAVSGADGTYYMELEPGSYEAYFEAFGYKMKMRRLEALPSATIQLPMYLERVDFVSDEIVITARRDKSEVVKNTITREDIKKVAGTGGDALRAVQSLPGVAATSDYSSGMAVQGGGPDDNLYLLDGIPWPYPFHFGGFMSTVYSELLSSVDLHSAGFGPAWGDVMGAVLVAQTRPGAKDGFHGSADISMITSQILLEAPLGLGDASIALYGRRSYIDLLLGSGVGFTAFPFYWDIGGTLDFTFGNDNKFKAVALANDDMMKLIVDPSENTDTAFSGEFSMDNGAFTGGITWANTSVQGFNSKLALYYYDLFEKAIIGQDFNIDIGQSNFGLKWEAGTSALELFGLEHEPAFGAGLERIHDDATVEMAFNILSGTDEPASTYVDGWHSLGWLFLQDRMKLAQGLFLSAGVRYDKNNMVDRDTTLPRLSVLWQPDTETGITAAWGLYSQFPSDVELNADFGNPQLSPELAQHTVLSVERKITREIKVRAGIYYKYYTGLVTSIDDARIYDNSGSGSAKGAELYIEAKYGERFFGWFSYALSESERLEPGKEWALYRYDQTHIVTAVANFSVTPAWSVGTKLHYNTGPLAKKLLSRYQDPDGVWHGVFSDGYEERLDDYLRLDLRTDYSFKFEGWSLNVYVELINVLNRGNPTDRMYSDDYSTYQNINNLPFIPYLGVEAEF